MTSSDTFAASELELVNKEVSSPMGDGLVAKDSEELMLVPVSVLTGEKSLLDVRGVTPDVTSDGAISGDVTSDGISDENMFSSPEPSGSVAPESEVMPCQTTIFKLQYLFIFCAQNSWM
jgi:hypothetical protein